MSQSPKAELKMILHHPQVTLEAVSDVDVVAVQPLFCLSEVSGGTRHQDLRQYPGSALTS